MMRVISIENIILFHEKIIKETGGSAGIRDKIIINKNALKLSYKCTAFCYFMK
ncbi:MAG: Death on curing protein, Doc toxin [Firmicutes bacterium]|nr:Death on curing protein, Doc toxin [Bacillota bacterium]